ncbi:MAG: ScyD/ScyE family protein [Candidatus Limnocylindria bacterium]
MGFTGRTSTTLRRLVAAAMTAALAMAPATAAAAEEYEHAGTAFDIAAAPNGGILLADGGTGVIYELRNGRSTPLASVAIPVTVPPTTLNGLAPIGRGNVFATTGGGDLATGAKLWRVSPGGARMVADIEAFETNNDPDALAGPMWKDQRCEAVPPFNAGPQSNPYHVAARSGGEALVADAAGNTLLSAKTNGDIDWVAVFTPPTADGSGSIDPSEWLALFPLDADTTCYVQPVPTSVAIGPDGAVYVGELTGATPTNLGGLASTGQSRIWRIAPGAQNVVCPSAQCTVVASGLTSVIDLAFGPDGALYAVEWDANGWFAALVLGTPAGGTVQRCDVSTGACAPIATGLALPGAITFDGEGNLWVLENVFAPMVRMLP